MKKTSRAVSRLQRVQKLSAKGAARGARRRTRMAGMPPHTFVAEAMHDFAGDAEKDTFSVMASEVLIVQGDRPPPTEGWSWCCRAGHSGLLPSSYLEVRASKSFAVRMLFDFVGSDPAELSCAAGAMLQALPDAADPLGWCTAVMNQRHGLVPQHYIQPVLAPSSPTLSARERQLQQLRGCKPAAESARAAMSSIPKPPISHLK